VNFTKKDLIHTRTHTIKELWMNLNQISSLCTTRTSTIILIYNGKEFTESSDICSAINSYFCYVGPSLVQSLKSVGICDFKKYCPNPCKNSIFCCPVTTDEIIRIMHKFPNNKAPGNDNINSKILKEVSDIIADPLTFIFNLSFKTGLVPDLLKIAKTEK